MYLEEPQVRDLIEPQHCSAASFQQLAERDDCAGFEVWEYFQIVLVFNKYCRNYYLHGALIVTRSAR